MKYKRGKNSHSFFNKEKKLELDIIRRRTRFLWIIREKGNKKGENNMEESLKIT